jgi:hypothetical protein
MEILIIAVLKKLTISCQFFLNLWEPPVIFAGLKNRKMPKKIKPTGKQKSMFMVHTVVFIIATVLSCMFYDAGAKGWAYPWHAWTIAAWALCLLGHWCIVYTSFEDAGYDTYRQQQGKQ